MANSSVNNLAPARGNLTGGLGGFESIKDNLHNTDIEKAFDLPKRRAPDSKTGRNRCMR